MLYTGQCIMYTVECIMYYVYVLCIYIYIYIYIYIRRPRQTQGGARQGIRHCPPSGRAVWLQPILCKFSVLFLSFRRDVREFLGGILGLQGHGVSRSGRAVWLCLCAVAAAAAANFLQVFCSVSRVSDVTLESFWVRFSDSCVLQGHGVSVWRGVHFGSLQQQLLCC